MSEITEEIEKVLAQVMGIDRNHEIFNLWYEIKFLRKILNTILQNNPSLADCLTQSAIESVRFQSQIEIQQKFPHSNITFPESQNIEENKQEGVNT